MKDKFNIKVIILVLLLIISIFYLIFLRKQKTEISFPGIPIQSSNSITYIPDQGNPESIVIDFTKCSPGRNSVNNPFGYTYFVFEGIKNNNCIFHYGRNLENPRGDISSFTKCSVPVSLGQKTFTNYGTKLEEIQNYCTKPK